ncbi:MAG: thymidine kinase [Actinobacteria bacterium]|nr:thymidine kinase [Actinomycetota bacterium]
MATLRFSFGTMGSGKSTLALQIHHNLSSRGLRGLLLTKLDRDGAQVTSRLGVSSPAVDIGSTPSIVALARQHMPLDFIYAFGLITDFKGLLFDGTKRMLEIADQRIEMQVEARCWCGARATNNARLVNEKVVFEGETVVVGDTATTRKEPLFGDVVRYELLCRYHYRRGQLAPHMS